MTGNGATQARIRGLMEHVFFFGGGAWGGKHYTNITSGVTEGDRLTLGFKYGEPFLFANICQ